MTGDTGSHTAQSPMNRVGAHLGHNERSNALRRYLKSKGIALESCHDLQFAAYGPLGNVPEDKELYRLARAKTAAVEKALWLDMEAAGLKMLNECPRCRTNHEAADFAAVRNAFAPFLRN
jgi:hypothetical protein